jgi:hypothetical protein
MLWRVISYPCEAGEEGGVEKEIGPLGQLQQQVHLLVMVPWLCSCRQVWMARSKQMEREVGIAGGEGEGVGGGEGEGEDRVKVAPIS